MASFSSRVLLIFGVFAAALFAPLSSLGQRNPSGPKPGAANPGPEIPTSLRVMVRDSGGAPLDLALVTLNSMEGGMYRQGTTKGGQVEFNNLSPGLYSVQVTAPRFETATESVNALGPGAMVFVTLRPPAEAAASAAGTGTTGLPILSPKVQKLVGKALEALRAGKPGDARSSLEEAYRLAPGHPYVNYLYGVYFSETNDWPQAKSYWERAVNIYPKHVASLLSLGGAMLRENRPAEAVPYLNRAIEAEPTAWRPQAVMAQACFNQRQYAEASQHAERALELGHGQATDAQLLMARAEAAQGNKERAVAALRNYLKDRPADSSAQKMLDSLLAPPASPATSPAAPPAATPPSGASPTAPPPDTSPAVLPPLSAMWIPPDVDEKVPPVEPGVPCQLDEVLQRAGLRMAELVSNVDRFTATESLLHERINSGGFPSRVERRTFNYLVSIGAMESGHFNVEEYRDGGPSLEEFPDRIATLGLPSLVLLFHPSEAANFGFSCEGLARSESGLSWLVRFQQRPDRPATMRAYNTGGHIYPIALKGRAWITAESFQVVRMETDLVSPIPEIQLLGEHTAIEYGPVRFRSKNASLWLPQTAEVYFDWRGKRVHRRHSFSNYVLFSVDNKQRILPPKMENTTAQDSSALPVQSKPHPPQR